MPDIGNRSATKWNAGERYNALSTIGMGYSITRSVPGRVSLKQDLMPVRTPTKVVVKWSLMNSYGF